MDGKTILILLAGLAVFGAVFFLASWVYDLRRMRSMSYIELRNAQIEEELYLERRGSRSERFRRQLRDLGYEGDPAPLVIIVSFAYLLLGSVLSIVGLPALTSLFIALPTSILATLMYLTSRKRKQKEKATAQVLQLLRNAVTFLESGSTPQTAFARAALLVENPLKKDVTDALNARVGTDPLAKAFETISEKYPSQAMTLLCAALEVNDKVGAKLAPTLRQAQKIVEQQMELSAEATAEVSQAKAEFVGIAVIIGAVGVMMIITGGDASREAYTSPMGIVFISLGIANFAFGVWRTMRTLNKARSGQL